ncbi:MAG: carbohydrate kinase [Bacteroidetes bacterium]|nr:carbohydrate kinase [Bacteroidota bacterium]MBU1115229.1 carbohydrate kinase [Bacteroidota bacterium]MBU1797247.1 carbohydrate kinase [Bacteroidota bacterium]
MHKKFLVGFDIGSSSVKVSIIDSDNGELVSSAFSPETEMKIDSPNVGWAEQHPDDWWKHLVTSTQKAISKLSNTNYEISGIGISYQMHGLVMVDKNNAVLYPSIIWCDSRAVEIGDKAFEDLGKDYCLGNCLNSPGNFTASKIKWIKDNQPKIYEKIYKIMLPGDYIALKLTGEINTTVSGLSEGIFWDFNKNSIADYVFDYYSINKDFIPNIVPTFGIQGKLTKSASEELGLKPGIPISYRAGDQPNNAFSLNVLNKGEIAATAGTSGVVYGIVEKNSYDLHSRVNSFAHVNYSNENPLKGVLLCINGTGILYNWLKNELIRTNESYEELNSLANKINVGSDGITVIPFGNGAERVLKNQNIGSHILGINFNNHTREHILRAAQEGIAFSFRYGIDLMKEMGIEVNLMRAGKANMFLSDIFSEAVANTSNATVELYNTDGAQGAARGAGVGANIYNSFEEAFVGFKKLMEIVPNAKLVSQYEEAYQRWKEKLNYFLT